MNNSDTKIVTRKDYLNQRIRQDDLISLQNKHEDIGMIKLFFYNLYVGENEIFLIIIIINIIIICCCFLVILIVAVDLFASMLSIIYRY